MGRRTWWLGLTAAVAGVGLAAATPPVDPLVEGWEPDPVAREFYVPAKPPTGSVAAPAAPAASADEASVWGIAADMLEMLLDHFTIPLGTAVAVDTVVGL